MMFCDLHMHSTASDGMDEPAALAALARDAGLSAMALTDHDTTSGLGDCAAAAKRLGIGFLPGIELSANPDLEISGHSGSRGDDVAPVGTLHILGYGVRHDDAGLLEVQQWLLEARSQRNPAMVDKLNTMGVKIDYQEVLDEAGVDGERVRVVGRPHIARVLIRKGYVKSVHEAFTRYIGEGAAAYTRKDRLPAAKAIEVIHHAGGLAFLAHPVQLRLAEMDAIEHVVARLKAMGLDGIETRHSDHSLAQVEQFQTIADRLGLHQSGGSDYHGSRKSIALGCCRVPSEVFDRLRDALADT